MDRWEHALLAPSMGAPLVVSAGPACFGVHAGSVKLGSPGNQLFTPQGFVDRVELAHRSRC